MMDDAPPESAHSPEDSLDLLKVSDVTRGRNPIYRFQGAYTFDDLKSEGAIACQWLAQPETSGLRIQGSVQGSLALDCGRCLTAYTMPINLTLDEHYVFSRLVEAYGKEKELQAEDFFEVVDEEGTLDLKDLVHQFLLMELDERPTCGREECRFVQE